MMAGVPAKGSEVAVSADTGALEGTEYSIVSSAECCTRVRCVRASAVVAASGRLACSDSHRLPLSCWNAFLERNRHVAPDLDCENYGSREQQGTHGDMSHRREDHG